MLYIVYKVAREILGSVIRNINSVRNELLKEGLNKAVPGILMIKLELFNIPFFLYILALV